MKLEEIIALIRKENTALIGKMPERKAMRLIRAAFQQVAREVSAAKEGVVTAPGLGRFRIREVERTSAGEKSRTRHVVFRAAEVKAKPAEKSGGKSR